MIGLTIKPFSLDGAQEELRAVGAGTSISHGQDSRSSVLEGEILVLKLVAVDGLSSGSISSGEVTCSVNCVVRKMLVIKSKCDQYFRCFHNNPMYICENKRKNRNTTIMIYSNSIGATCTSHMTNSL